MVAVPHLTDDERFPLLDGPSRIFLNALRQHPWAPRYNMRCGDRLDASGLGEVRAFEEDLFSNPPAWRPGEPPSWVGGFVSHCLRDVPIYRRNIPPSPDHDLQTLPTVSRDDLASEPWSFVPDTVPLDDLIVYYTSGTHGQPIDVLADPVFASKRLPLFRAALAAQGVKLEGGPGRVSIVFVCSQMRTLTYASLSSFLGGAAHLKVNLNPGEWNDPEDRIRFYKEYDPEVYSGDPLAFLDLAELPITTKPKALISSAMHLVPETRRILEERFACPVADIFSTCESGPIAFSYDGSSFRILPNDIYVEVLDEEGRNVGAGVRGEIAITGGRNPFFPMLRYRTGDWGSLSYENGAPVLRELEGRAPVVFEGMAGNRINNLDVTTVLRRFALAQFSLHQNLDRSLVFRFRGAVSSTDEILAELRRLFGASQPIAIEPIPADVWKVLPYSRD